MDAPSQASGSTSAARRASAPGLSRNALRAWVLIHKWTSLVCTAFLLMLCLTGLPLIFHEELEDLTGHRAPLETVAPGTVPPTLDAVVDGVLAQRPGEVAQSLLFEPDLPVVIVATAPRVDASPREAHMQPVDLRTGKLAPPPPQREGFIWFVRELHVRMFLGLPGTLCLGAMGLLFLAATVSGVVIYAPFMRKLTFGAVRVGQSRRLVWLDLHNLLGIATAGWLLVVGVTGVFNSLDEPLAHQWRNGQLAEMRAPYADASPLARLGSLDAAVATARRASPDMEPSVIAYPGSFFATPHHYNVFMRGASPVTERLLKPTLVDAETAVLTDTRDMPLHIRALFLARPLHFGDYGGLLLKVVWALLDIVAIIVLVSGLHLWGARARIPAAVRANDLVRGQDGEGAR
jgi:uncharacterized iron-regulated membrane protein